MSLSASTSHPNRTVITHAYRHLLRTSLHAVQFSTPARYTIRWRLRLAFRGSPAHYFDAARMRNTLQFLANARERRGLEHKVLRALLHTWWWEERRLKDPERSGRRVRSRRGTEAEDRERRVRMRAMEGFRWLVGMLNESMGMCIR